MLTIASDIGDPVQGHAVLGRPAADFPGVRVMLPGKGLRHRPAFSLFSGTVGPAAQEQKRAIVPKGKAVVCLVHIHPVQLLLVDDGKMRGDHDSLSPDPAIVGAHGVPRKGAGRRVLPDVESPGQTGGKFQGMELGLPLKTDASGGGNGQRQPVPVLSAGADALQRAHLPFQLAGRVNGVHKGVLCLKIAGDGQLPVPLQRRLIGPPVHAGRFHAEFPDELIVDQAVLGRELCRGIPGDPGTYGIRLDEKAVNVGLRHGIRAQKPRHSPAYDQHIGRCVMLQVRKGRQRRRIRPYRIDHVYHHF